MDNYDEVNPYETTRQKNDSDIESDPAKAVHTGRQGYANQMPQQNYQPQQYVQPNVQQQQYVQPNVQQQYVQPNVQQQYNPYQQYNQNTQVVDNAYQQYVYQNSVPRGPHGSAKGLGIAGMVCGIVSLVSSIYVITGFIAGILGLIFSIIAKKKSAEQRVTNSKANAGLVMSIIGLVLAAFITFCIIVYAVNDPVGFRRTLMEVLD